MYESDASEGGQIQRSCVDSPSNIYIQMRPLQQQARWLIALVCKFTSGRRVIIFRSLSTGIWNMQPAQDLEHKQRNHSIVHVL